MDWFNTIFGGGGPIQGAGRSVMGALNSLGGGMMNMFGGGRGGGGGGMSIGGNRSNYGSGNVPMGFPANAASRGGMISQFNPAMTGAGLGIMGLGQMMNPPTKMPDFGQNPAVQQLMGWQNQPNHPMDPNVAQAIQGTTNVQNEQQLRNLRDVYKNARPGTDYTTDSAYQRDLAGLNRQMSMDAADVMAASQFASNQQQMGNLTNMAKLGVGQQMGNANLKAQRRQQQNKMFGDIGSMFLQRGLGMPDFMNIFGGGGR